MTKAALKAEMISIINRAYEHESQEKDENRKHFYLGEVAGVELLAAKLKIKLWG